MEEKDDQVSEEWQEFQEFPSEIKEPSSIKEKLPTILLFLGSLIFITGLGFFLITWYLSSSKVKDLSISINGPDKVEALKSTIYTIKIYNKSKKTLTNTTLEINLSEGAFFEKNPSEKNNVITLGDIKPNETKIQEVNLIFFGEENRLENINVSFNYKVENKPQIFTETKSFNVSITKLPVIIQANIPSQVIVHQPFSISFKLFNNSDIPVNLQFELQPPSYFEEKIVDPPPMIENTWLFENFYKNTDKEIKITGKLNKLPPLTAFNYRLKIIWEEIEFSLPLKIIRFSARESPVILSIESSPSNSVIDIGSFLNYKINIKNQSQITLHDVQVKANLVGLFDESSVITNGYFSNVDNSILWNARVEPKLENLTPNEEVVFDFKVRIKNEFPILEKTINQDKNFNFKVIVELMTKSIPPEITIEGDTFSIKVEDEKKIIGQIIASQSLSYNSQYFESKGPFPLKPGEETYLTWEIHLKTAGEDFENVSLETKLPEGVEPLNAVSGDVDINKIFFDKTTGRFVYNIDKLEANRGFIYDDYILVFLLSVKPPLNIYQYPIIGDLSIKAKGSFTGEVIKMTLNKLTERDIKNEKPR